MLFPTSPKTIDYGMASWDSHGKARGCYSMDPIGYLMGHPARRLVVVGGSRSLRRLRPVAAVFSSFRSAFLYGSIVYIVINYRIVGGGGHLAIELFTVRSHFLCLSNDKLKLSSPCPTPLLIK